MMPLYRAHRILPYTPEQLFNLAADVERYPDFLPWWVAARVRSCEGDVYDTDQVVRIGVIRQRFGSKTVLRRPERIDVTSTDRAFRKFHLTWLFDLLPDNQCQVALVLELELRSRRFQDLFGREISRKVEAIMAAFENRAHQIYGPTAVSGVTARNGVSNGPVT